MTMVRDGDDGGGENDGVLVALLAFSCSIGCDRDDGGDTDDGA